MPEFSFRPRDRIELIGWLLLVCFAAVVLLSSQSAASFFTYLLTLLVLSSYRIWFDLARNELFILVVGLLLYLSLSVFWSEPWTWRDFGSMLVRTLLVCAFIIGMALVQLRGQVQLWLRRVMVLVGGGAVIVAVVNYLTWPPEGGRLNGLGQLDTHVVAALVYGFVSILALQACLRETTLLWRIPAGLTILISTYAIYASDSRNAWVSYALGFCVLLLAEKIRDRDLFRSGVMMVGVLAGITLIFLFVNETTQSLLLPRGTSFRPEIWDQAISRIFDGHAWFGLGINTENNFLVFESVILHPHNLYLSVLYQGGFVALGMFLLVLWRTLHELLLAYEDADAKLALGVLGLALPAYMLDGHELLDKIGSTWFLIWLPVAIAVGLRWSRALQKH